MPSRSSLAGLSFVAMLLGWHASLAEPRAALVQSVDLQIPVAPTPVTVAGKRHVAYELHITNFRPVDVELLRIDVLDEGNDQTLASFSGTRLIERLSRVGARVEGAERQRVPSGGRAILFLWLPIESDVPSRLKHTIELDLLRSSGRERAAVADNGMSVRAEKPVVLDTPVRGGPWVALYNPTMVGGHRTSIYTLEGRARIPARFAIDWVKLGDDASHARGDASRIASWHGYGAEVLAVADGIVAEALDDLQEGPTLADATGDIALEDASGNHVTLDLGRNRYAFYEHLKPGSITVKRGERVKRGQVIARLGNSGSSSSGPHLHFHLADSAAALAGEGIPYVFRNFDVLGTFDDIDAFATGQRWQPSSAGTRRMELPAANTVVVFPR